MEKPAPTEPKEAPAKPESAAAPPPAEKPRTPGLKAFDFFLYPVITNFGVLTLSMGATYLTARGGDKDASGKLIYGKIGPFFQKRGEWLTNKFKSLGMSHGQADMGKMVFFSFLDGSLLAPVVKVAEDHREDIGCYIDRQLGTAPEDLSVYQKEPKQTWKSVLGGRFATAAIVVPTAVALDKTGLNDVLFNEPGRRAGEALAKNPTIAKAFGKLDVKELSRIGFFEAFYTSVCTAGLYFSSRFIAKMGKKEKEKPEAEKPSCADQLAQAHSAKDVAPEPTAEPAKTVTRHFAHEGLKRPKLDITKAETYRERREMEAVNGMAPALG